MLSFPKQLMFFFGLMVFSSGQFTALSSDISEVVTDTNPVVQVCEGVWAGKGFAANGEPIYFGLERIDDQNRDDWEYYIDYARKMVGSPSSHLLGLVEALWYGKPTEAQNIASKLEVQRDTGFTEAELTSYLQYMQSKGSDTASLGALDILSARPNLTEPDTYFAYISKKPITGKFSSFPEKYFDPKTKKYQYNYRFKLAEFVRCFDSILICVGVHKTPLDCESDSDISMLGYESRGIFKNPNAVFNNNYKGLSIFLLAFTAAAIKNISEEKKFLTVSPLKSIHDILCKSFKPCEMFVAPTGARRPYLCGFTPPPSDLSILDDPEAEQRYLEENLALNDSQKNTGVYSEREHLIKISALIRLYENMRKAKGQ